MEGVRLCKEAFKSKLEITACIRAKDFDKLVIPESTPQYEANNTQMEQVSDSKSPQGIICVAKIPDSGQVPVPKAETTLLVLDRISDPGNMGTIFRTALWFGITDVLLGPDCVDPFNPKVVRSSMGAIASLKLHFSEDLIESASSWKAKEGSVVALHMDGEVLDHSKFENGLFLIVGSEAHGVDPELLSLAMPLSIGKSGQGESLNAAIATGIALYELSR